MAVNRNKRNKLGQKGSYDILGVLLLIVSSIFLLCLIFPPIFSIISVGIRYVLLGLFGLFSYFLFGGLFAIGLCLVLRRPLAIQKRSLLLLSFAVFVSIIVLQTVTTYAMLSASFESYIYDVFTLQYSVGGILFGSLSYWLAMLFSPLLSVVFLAVVAVFVLTLIVYAIYRKYVPKSQTRENVTTDKQEQTIEPTYVDNTVQPANQSLSSLFSDRIITNVGSSKNTSRTTGRLNTLFIEGDNDIHSNQDMRDTNKNRAADLLYPADLSQNITRNPDSGREHLYAASTSVQSIEIKPIVVAPDEVAEEKSIPRPAMPVKVVHPEFGKYAVIMPTPKKDNDINAEALNGIVDAGSISSATQNHIETEYYEQQGNNNDVISPKNTSGAYVNPNPIIVADSQYDRQDVQPESSSNPSIHTNIPNTKIINNNPIISSDDFVNPSSSYQTSEVSLSKQTVKKVNPTVQKNDDDNKYSWFSKLSNIDDSDSIKLANDTVADNEENSIFSQSTIDESTAFDSSSENDVATQTNDDIITESETSTTSGKTDTIIDDVSAFDKADDLTITNFDFENSDTGYYIKETPTPVVKKAKKPIYETKAETISMDDVIDEYVKENNIQSSFKTRNMNYIYNAPPLDLLNDVPEQDNTDEEEIRTNTESIEEILATLKYPAKVKNVIKGPTVTRYELNPPSGKSVKKIQEHKQDLAYQLAATDVRIEAPVSGKQAIGIEVPNKIKEIVYLKEFFESEEFVGKKGGLPLVLGKDLGGDILISDLCKMPHLLVAGSTGTGKSVCLNALIMSLIYHCSPEDMRLVLIDPKCLEFVSYKNLPHLLTAEYITSVQDAISSFDWAILEMETRYAIMSKYRVKNVAEYNELDDVKNGIVPKLPYIVFIVDELADLLSTRKSEMEERIMRLTQKSRASGIHLILATQRPSVDVITGTIKNNLPCRISFRVTSFADSKTIINVGGAEALLGNGDMLYMGVSEIKRLQGPWVQNKEIDDIVQYVIDNNEAVFDPDIEKAIFKHPEPVAETTTQDSPIETEEDRILPGIMRAFIKSNKASTSLIQRRFSF